MARKGRRAPRQPQPLPPPLAPEDRTVGQLVAETIRFYQHHFWRTLPLGLSVAADLWSGAERRQPATLPGWPFDVVLYALAALQLVNVVLAARLVGATGFFDWHTLVAVALVGTNSGYSGIVVAHELIHRREPHLRAIGRALMGLVLYEHFSTEEGDG